MEIVANALPTKRFFIDNIVRDITLEDAILDLVDNCIDAYVRTNSVDVSAEMLMSTTIKRGRTQSPASLVAIRLTEDEFQISDKCGGIELRHAEEVVFRFGRPASELASSLGVYGIGLKRALFKLGKRITIESHTASSGFKLDLSVDKWAEDDRTWEIPLQELPPARPPKQAGTTIIVKELNEEVRLRLKGSGFLRRLGEGIAQTYPLFLQQFLTVTLNGHAVEPALLPIARSEQLPPGHNTFQWNGVTLDLYAGLAPREGDTWNADRAGWYVLCNGRVVVTADKTSLTGWGLYGPTFQPKHRGFVGIAFFFSSDPTSLPWTTTKRGLNVDSRVYQLAQKEMSLISKPVLSFLNSMYRSEGADEIPQRELPGDLKAIPIAQLAGTPRSPFRAPDTPRMKEKTRTVQVQFPAQRADVERIKKHLNRPKWGAARVGKHTFDHYLKMELPE